MKETEKQSSQPDKKPDTSCKGGEPSGFFQQLKTRIKNTELYQIYFVRAQQNSFSKCLKLLFIICAVIGYYGFNYFLNPPIKFDEMKVIQGYLQESYKASRRSFNSIVIKNEKGEIKKFTFFTRNYVEEQKLNSLIGELITIYYSNYIDLFFCPNKIVQEIRYKDTVIHKYQPSEYYSQRILYEGGRKTFIFFSVTSFILLFIVYLRHRKC